MTTNFLNNIKPGALNSWKKYKVLPSIVGAQAALESAWGKSGLAVKGKNLFGVKSSSDWKGKTITMRTAEQRKNGEVYYVNAKFRAYDSWADSVEDHGQFFTSTIWRRNNYKHVIGEKNYKIAAQALRNAGYATDIKYPQKLISIIEKYGLNKWDEEVLNTKAAPAPVKKPTVPKKKNETKTNNKTSVYTVKRGDNLTKIAKEQGTTVASLLTWNDIDDPNVIFVGQKLKYVKSAQKAPKTTVYTVRKGDNLTAIAKKHKTTVAALTKKNNIKDPDKIYPGQKIKI